MAAIIPKRTLEDIRIRNDIVDVIGSYFNVLRAGSSAKALCPFHKEKTPSFHINSQRQIFHCFGCGAGGDVFKFIMQYEGVDFVGAVKLLAQRAGVPLELEEAEGGGPDKSVLYRLHDEVSKLYHRALQERKSAAVARAYLEKRELPAEIIEDFFLGYAPDRWDAVLTWGQDNHYTLEQVETAGLILKKSGASGASASELYDRFRNRLMFPIRDEQGRVIGFSGRSLDDHDKTAKYVNSPDTPLFHKSRVLYALDRARRHIVECREAIICEGQIDVIRCHSAGFTTAVASQGTAFTEDHVRILRRYADSVVLMFDADKAGQDAAIRTAGTFMSAGLAVRVAALPPGEDPDSFIRKNGPDAFRGVLDRATSAVRFQIDVLSGRENARSEIGVMRIAKAVLETVSHSPNAVQKAKLIQEAAERLGVPATSLQDDLRFMARNAREPGVSRAAEPGPVKRGPQPKEEVELCEHLVHVMDVPELGPLVRDYLPLTMITDPLCRTVVKAALESVASGKDLQVVLRDEEDPTGELQSFAAQVQMAPSKALGNEVGPADAVKGQILHIWQRKLKDERAELEKKYAATPDRQAESRRVHITNALDLFKSKKWTDEVAALIKIEIELAPTHRPITPA